MIDWQQLRCYIVDTMVREVPQPTTSGGVLEECQSSPGLLLALLGQVAMRRLREVHTARNLKPRQFQLLGLLHDRGAAMGQRELGEAMGVDPSILVTLLNPLEADGFVSRERDPEDRRRHVVRLTAAGRRCLESAMRAQREAEDELFAGLDDDQRRQLGAVLVALRDSLASGDEDACAPPETTEEC
jgi:DNA-binding MarR family transcriptional regulator